MSPVLMKCEFVTKIQVPKHFLFLADDTEIYLIYSGEEENLATVSQAESGV
jgi:hypothetical protein